MLVKRALNFDMKKINSRQNAFFKSLLNPKKSGTFLLEGIRYIKTALERGMVPTSVVFVDSAQVENLAQELRTSFRGLQGGEGENDGVSFPHADELTFVSSFVALPENLFREITETEHSQGVVAVYERTEFVQTLEDVTGTMPFMRSRKPNSHCGEESDLLLVLDEIQDPGNVGTIIRTADACGIRWILAVKGTADVLSQKVVRSTAGSILNVRVCYGSREEIISFLLHNQYEIIAADMGGVRYKDFTRKPKAALVLGNEARGVHPSFLENSSTIAIPMYGGAESLNVAVAAGILMYELREEK